MGTCILVSGAMLYPIPAIQRCLKRRLDPEDAAWGKKSAFVEGDATAPERQEMLSVA